MTVREINALRKSGHLSEALEAAENEFSQNANVYTVRALFWCLNDLYKTQPSEEAAGTIERMKSLYSTYCSGDEYMQRSIAAAENSLIPHYREVRGMASSAREGGDAIGFYNELVRLHDAGELDARLFNDFGWVIYFALKRTSLADAHTRKVMLGRYLKLELPRPSMLHSLILCEAVKVEQNTPLQFRIRDFMRLWGFDNLREDDWQQYRTDEGNLLPSLVEKLIGVYARELKTDKVRASDEFSALVDKALEIYPSNQNMPYFKATVLISQGRKDEAIGYYRDLILRFPTKFYLWHHTAELIDDVDTKIGLLSKALTVGVDEQFLGGVRLMMARLLIAKGDLAHAKYEMEKYREIYQSMGWNLRPEYQQLCNQIAGVEAAEDNRQLYSQYSQVAETFIYSQLPVQVAVKVSKKQLDNRNRPGRRILLWILRTTDGVLRLKNPSRYGLSRRANNGSAYKVRVYEGKIVWIEKCNRLPELDWVKEIEGVVTIRTNQSGKRFAIINGAYVGERLLASVANGQPVRIIAVKQTDGRWSAVTLTSLN